MLANFSDYGTKKLNKRTLIIKPATLKSFGNIAKIHSNHKAILSSRILVKTPATNIFKKAFTIPLWLKPLDLPTNEFNLEKPTYREITNVIRKTKLSASPCPLDQISVIALKNCPYLGTQLWRFISKAWENALFIKTWRKGITILIHKKDSNKNPSNFRPIILQPILSKIFTSIIRNRIFTFVLQDKYIKTNLQKGFWEKISGCIEHTETLTYVINHARKKQRNLVTTLLNLKNAFGEVDHDLTTYVLKFHHVPDHIIQKIKSLYTDHRISIATDEYLTLPITVEKGVQGDSLSPLLFNLVIITLINTIKQEKLNCIGYIYDGCMPPKRWLQFTDDTAIVTALESDNQHLVDAFTKWSSWAGLIIRVDKCSTFGIKKVRTDSTQYKPYLKIANERIPSIEMNKSFTYLGKDFNMHMSNDHIKSQLVCTIEQYLQVTDRLLLHPLQKIEICQRFIFSKLKWQFSIYNLTETWVAETLDNKFSKFYRRWLQIPVSGNISHLSLPRGKLDLEIKTLKQIYNECKVSNRSILKCSLKTEAQKLY